MRIYIPDMNDFFSYMDKKSWSYAVLRGYREFIKDFPPYGSKQDIDILIPEEDHLVLGQGFRNELKVLISLTFEVDALDHHAGRDAAALA